MLVELRERDPRTHRGRPGRHGRRPSRWSLHAGVRRLQHILQPAHRESQAACFEAVAARLSPDGGFVIEAFVPDDPPRRGDDIAVRTLEADRVVLSISRHDPEQQSAEGQFVEFTESGGVRLRPWSIRYAAPSELDEMAARAGMTLEPVGKPSAGPRSTTTPPATFRSTDCVEEHESTTRACTAAPRSKWSTFRGGCPILDNP